MLTQVCPILVLKKDENYACIGNRRVLNIVKATTAMKGKVTVLVLPQDVDDVLVRKIALVDIFVLPLLHVAGKSIQTQLKKAKSLSESDESGWSDGMSFKGRRKKVKTTQIATVNREEYGIDYRLKDVSGLTSSALQILMLLSPPWLIKKEAGDYVCLLNRRVCEVVCSCLGNRESLEARMLGSNVPTEELVCLEAGMIEPLHLLWKWAGKSLANIYSNMTGLDKALVFNVPETNQGLAGSLGYSREHMFSPFGVSRIDPGDDGKTEDLSQYQIGTKECTDEK
jgi:hypothetical protein